MDWSDSLILVSEQSLDSMVECGFESVLAASSVCGEFQRSLHVRFLLPAGYKEGKSVCGGQSFEKMSLTAGNQC